MSGIVGGVKSLIKGPEKPKTFSAQESLNDQIAAAQAKAKYGLYGIEGSPFGSTRTTEDPTTGQISREFDISPDDVTRGNLISQGLGGVELDPTRAEDAYFDRATRQLLPQFERQGERLDENLINRGIGVGTEQYNQQTEDLRNIQQGTLADLANKSVFAGQDYTGGQIGNINKLAAGRDILSLAQLASPTGANIGSQYANAIQSQNQNAQWQNKADQEGLQQGIQLAAMFSDISLKENLNVVGELDNGLKVYIGNYNDKAIELDPTLNKKPQLFLIAQEVFNRMPEAVEEDRGYMRLDYGKAVLDV